MRAARISPRLRAAGFALLAFAFAPPLLALAGPATQIGADALIGPSGSQDDTQVEPHIAVDPNNASILVAVVQQGRFLSDGGSVDPGWAVSHDRGATWTSSDLPHLTVAVGGAFDRGSDPAVAFGPDGAVYAQTLVFDVPGCRSAVAVQRSDDGGQSFGDPVLVQDDLDCGVINDKTWIAVDTSAASPHRGRIYSAWDQSKAGGQPIVLRWSDDRGENWSALVTVSAGHAGGLGAIPLVQPGGDVTVVYTTGSVVAQTSHDGGATFDAPVLVGTLLGGEPPDMRTGRLPAAAVDPVTGHLFAVWQDLRFRSDGLNDIVISRSVDGGATWSAAARVNPDPPASGLDHLTPAVAARAGLVSVTYRTRAGTAPLVDMRHIASADDGASFCEEDVLGEPADLAYVATADGDYFLGDYMGIALSPATVHPVWCRSFANPGSPGSRHQTTWSAAIATAGLGCGPPPVVGQPVRGRRLALRTSATRVGLAVTARDPAIVLPASGGATDPVLHGASLRVATAAGEPFDVTYALSASSWSYIGKAGQIRGYRYRSPADGPIRSLLLRTGSLRVRGRGASLVQPLAADPDPVAVQFAIGSERLCASFGGTTQFQPGRYRAVSAPAPDACLP